MRFDRDDVRRIAALVRLDLSEAELDRFAEQLEPVLDHAAALEGLPGESPVAADESSGPAYRPRPDVRGEDPLTRSPAEFGPGFLDGYFTIPRMQAFDASPDPGPSDP